MEIFKTAKIYDFMGKKVPLLAVSTILVILSVVSLFTKGLNFGIDFAGGTVIQVKYEKEAPISQIRDILKNTKYSNAAITKFGSDEEIVIRITGTTSSLGVDIGEEMKNILAQTGKLEVRRVDMVGAKVGDELTHKGLMALLLSFVGILIYVTVRFEWKFALVSILSLLHDVVIAIGAVSFAQVEVNLDVLAAILTLLGYSLNDTIIIFDRIRERVQISKENDLDELINESVSRTLPRTTLTALTVFFTVYTLYAFGGEIIHGFAFTMLVGVIFGTYSSIFVASALLVPLKFSVSKYREKEAEKVRLQKEKERNRAMFEQGRV
jgi:preprotein translocase subunit SecF